MEKQMMKKTLSNRYIWIAFLVALLPRLIFLVYTQTLSISGDEIFSMWPAAKLAGYSWKQAMENYRYYGYGYTILLYPFIALIHHPVILYRCLVFLMILAQSVVAPISFHLMKTYFDVTNEKVVCLSAIACSYLVTVRAVYTYPEFIYDLVFWISVWVLLKLEHIRGKKKQQMAYTLLLFGVLMYALSVHSRATAVWGALIGLILIYAWIYRKSLVSIPVTVVVGVGGYVAIKTGISILLHYLGYSSGTSVSNTSASVSTSAFKLLLDSNSWTGWLDIILGQLNEAIINTGGLAVGIVIALVALLWQALCRKKDILEENKINYRPYIVIAVYCMLAIIITIGGQSVKWLPSVMNALSGENTDGFRAFTYFRYYGAYAGPLLMIGIAYFAKRPDILQWVKGKTLVVAGLLQGYWVLCIIPLICHLNSCVWSYAPFSLTRGFSDEIRLLSYLPGTLAIVVVLVVSYILCKKKKQVLILWILCVYLMYSYGYNAVYHEGYRGALNYQYIKDGVELLETLEENGTTFEQIYVEGGSVPDSGQGILYLYQYNLPDVSVVEGMPEETIENTVYMCFCPEDYEELLSQGYYLGTISDHEYVYVYGDDMVEEMETYGVVFMK